MTSEEIIKKALKIMENKKYGYYMHPYLEALIDSILFELDRKEKRIQELEDKVKKMVGEINYAQSK